MSNVIKFDLRRPVWKEVFSRYDDYVSLHIFFDQREGYLEISQMNSEGKLNRTVLSKEDAKALTKVLSSKLLGK